MAICSEDGSTGAELLGGPGVLFAATGGRAYIELVVVLWVIDVEIVGADTDDRTLMLCWPVLILRVRE